MAIQEKKRYTINPENGCWDWIGAKNGAGYAAIKINGITYRSARIFYEKYKGKIPDGFEIDHLCRNKACVNPSHLEVVSHAENCRRRSTSKLDYEKVKKIRILYEKGRNQMRLSEIFNVGQDHISRIVNGLSWDLTK